MDPSFDRRGFLGALGAGFLVGCGAFPAESGAAYVPWEFPVEGDPPEMLAAHAALLAASPHNTQPWRLRVTPDRIDLLAAPTRHLGHMDSLRRELHIGLGCALENLVIAARAAGRAPDVTLFPDASMPDLAATVLLPGGPRVAGALFSAIPHRHTNRGAYLEGVAPPGLESALRALVDDPWVSFTFLDRSEPMRRFREGTIAATEAIVADTEMNDDSHAWYRHTAEEIERHRDGTTLDATGNGATTRYLGKTIARPTAATAGAYWIDGARGAQATASAYVLLSTAKRDDRAAQVRVGRVFQRMHLFATSEGLAIQPQNQMAERQDRDQSSGIQSPFGAELAALTGSSTSGVQMSFRIGVPWDDALKSPRRPLAWVIV